MNISVLFILTGRIHEKLYNEMINKLFINILYEFKNSKHGKSIK